MILIIQALRSAELRQRGLRNKSRPRCGYNIIDSRHPISEFPNRIIDHAGAHTQTHMAIPSGCAFKTRHD